MEDRNIRFYYGANTPAGFYSLFDELYDARDGWRAYIIKGGPGTGKSSLMRAVAGQLKEKGIGAEKVPCSSDPYSLDAVVFPELKVCLVDGTAPHTMEPKFPGAVEKIVNLGECWNDGLLREHAQEIISLTLKNSMSHRKCVRFLAAAASLRGDVCRLTKNCVLTEKVERYAARFASREFGPPNGGIGRESRRFLSAVTPIGVDANPGTAVSLCDRIFVIQDEYGAASSLFLSQLRAYAIGNGLNVISCRCPMGPADRTEHLIVPEKKLGIFTGNCYHPYRIEGAKVIHAGRFMDSQCLNGLRNRVSFSRKAQKELLDEAVAALKQAKATHDELEKYYIAAMDFDKAREKGREIAEEILAIR